MAREGVPLNVIQRQLGHTAEEAQDDAIWMQIDVPEPKLTGFERAVDSALGYREFELTDATVQEHRVVRAEAP
jgi:hypothetical protein